MSYKRKERSVAFTIRLLRRCVEIIGELIEAEIYSSRGECIRDIIRSAFRGGFHKKMLPEQAGAGSLGEQRNYRKHL